MDLAEKVDVTEEIDRSPQDAMCADGVAEESAGTDASLGAVDEERGIDEVINRRAKWTMVDDKTDILTSRGYR